MTLPRPGPIGHIRLAARVESELRLLPASVPVRPLCGLVMQARVTDAGWAGLRLLRLGE